MYDVIYRLAASMLLLALLMQPARGAAPFDNTLNLPNGTGIPLSHYPAAGRDLLLWLPSESGVLDQEKQAAVALAHLGVEVWFADMYAAYFLPTIASSIEHMPAADLAALIEYVRKTSGKNVYLIGSGRGALLALRGAHEWQVRHPNAAPLAGAILISPKLYQETPEPGLEGRLRPVVTATDLPLLILQPGKSIWRWKMKRIIPALSQGGSDVYTWYLPDVRDRFYYRPDAVPAEDAMAARLPRLVLESLPLLKAVADKPRPPVRITAKAAPPPPLRAERTLRPYRGNPRPPSLRLKDLDGKFHDLAAYKGRVVVVNFWATWCPPCVHEMPSMQRLKEKLTGRPFTILAVNMADDRSTIEDFLTRMVKVNFKILMDTDGAALARWKVFAFPTTYVVGKHGKVRYAVFGAVDWDDADVLGKLQGLLRE